MSEKSFDLEKKYAEQIRKEREIVNISLSVTDS